MCRFRETIREETNPFRSREGDSGEKMLTVESLHEVVEFFGLKTGFDPVPTQSTGML